MRLRVRTPRGDCSDCELLLSQQVESRREGRSVMERFRHAAPAVAVLLFLAQGPTLSADILEPVLDRANFTTPVQNRYFPLVPGTTYFYEAQTGEGLLRTEVSVTSSTKTIEGVAAFVVHDVVWLDVENGPTLLIE